MNLFIINLQIVYKTILSLVLIHELYRLSVHFFSFNRIITIDIRDNSKDNNYPIITLNIYGDIDEINENFYQVENKDCDDYDDYSDDYYDYLTLDEKTLNTKKWIDCRGYSVSYMLERKVIPWILNRSGLYFSGFDYIDSNFTSKYIIGWNVRESRQMSGHSTHTISDKT